MLSNRQTCLFALSTALFLFAIAAPAGAQQLPAKDQIMAKMILANDYFMAKWPDPTVDIVTDKTRPSNIWTRATYYEGLMAMYYIDPQTTYYDYAVEWADSHDWAPAYGTKNPLNADNQCAGQTYIELYQIDPQPERIATIKNYVDQMVGSSSVNDDWWWIDALHMAMPVFAKLGVVYDDDAYFEKMYDIYNYTKTQHGTNGLYNPVDHLWWRDSTFDPPHTAPNGEDEYWSRGNGWVFAAMTRVLDVMPADAPHRAEYATMFQGMADALVAVQREDGFWNVSLHDPTDYPGPETSGTAFFVYGLAWGVNNGLLVGDQYARAAIDGWNGLANDALHPDGFLGYVQSTGKQPSDGQPVTYDSVPNFEDYGLGAFLLAGSEVYQMANPDLPGDYNDDGIVDAADYTVWRDNLGQDVLLPGDTTPGAVSSADYDVWKEHYGEASGGGSLAGNAVCEPATVMLLPAAAGAAACCCRKRLIGRRCGR